ncbi:hypothetical protein [Paenibacillus dendrobii]|nr:hypothetical protein [Paenibacillus dendrobii]
MSSELFEFFRKLGVDPSKEGEFMEFGLNEKGEVHYMGFYHLVGNIIAGPTKIIDKWSSINLIKIDNYGLGFSSEDIACVPNDFPKPIIQLEFSCYIPWRIKEKYE